jgi:hypothetical protein
MLPSNPITITVILVSAFFFYCAAKFEGTSGALWGVLSVVVSLGVFYLLHGSFMLVLLGQVVLFIAITVFRARKGP